MSLCLCGGNSEVGFSLQLFSVSAFACPILSHAKPAKAQRGNLRPVSGGRSAGQQNERVENATGASRLHRPPITSITRFRPPRKTRTTRNQILASPFRVFRVFRGEHSDAWVRSPNHFTADHADSTDGEPEQAIFTGARGGSRAVHRPFFFAPFVSLCGQSGLRFQLSGFAVRSGRQAQALVEQALCHCSAIARAILEDRLEMQRSGSVSGV